MQKKISIPRSIWTGERAVELYTLAALFVWYFIWMSVIPFNDAPDELMKTDLIGYVFRTGIYPPGYEPVIINPVFGNSYAFEPATRYLADAGLQRVAVDWFGLGELRYYLSNRLLSVLLSCCNVFVLMRIGKRMLGKAFGMLFALMIALLPQYTFLSAYINNDIFALLCVTLCVYCLVRGIQDGFTTGVCVGFGLALGAGLVSYYYAYPMLMMCSICFVIAGVVQVRERRLGGRNWAVGVALMLVLAGLACAWYFIRNVMLYDGDLFAMNASTLCAERNAVPEWRPSVRQTPQNMGLSLGDMLTHKGYLKYTALSFIGVFGNMQIFLSPIFYLIYGAVLAVLFVCGLRVRRFMQASRGMKIFGVCLLLGMLGVAALSIYYSYTSDFQPQGRYLMQGMLPLYLMLCMGAQNLQRWLASKKPAVTAERFSLVIVGFLVIMNVAAFMALRKV